ncbi:YfiT family bacillithiol transferase [Reichenbachiella sp. MSK19-1]|uniref:YfiT family bacillithiol transferase n=1 Tax=Reichenbachiella sp. MSK19-1 TaxID=1897631 RepID=UPI000E6C04BB|nr:putative metal-dependent hydrolase [Reichenbachiella sp. MSK19-1]RJE71476.1 metal-dependent hydrolase [Reichenbachiella sp. MSK19-1]
MDEKTLYKLKYPIGEFEKPSSITTTQREMWINSIQSFPEGIKQLTDGLSIVQLNWPYRPDGWTIKQVVHHCADSHMNSLMRFKLALTEDSPEIRPYHEDRWAQLIDSQDDDLSYTLMLLEGLHYRLVSVIKNLSKTDLQREFVHPEHGKRFTLEETIGTYAWHSEHHLAHIQQALNAGGKFSPANP